MAVGNLVIAIGGMPSSSNVLLFAVLRVTAAVAANHPIIVPRDSCQRAHPNIILVALVQPVVPPAHLVDDDVAPSVLKQTTHHSLCAASGAMLLTVLLFAHRCCVPLLLLLILLGWLMGTLLSGGGDGCRGKDHSVVVSGVVSIAIATGAVLTSLRDAVALSTGGAVRRAIHCLDGSLLLL